MEKCAEKLVVGISCQNKLPSHLQQDQKLVHDRMNIQNNVKQYDLIQSETK